MKKIRKADGEITFFFVMILMMFYIVILLFINVINENNEAFEKMVREAANDTSRICYIYGKSTTTDVEGVLEKYIKPNLIRNSEIIHKGFLSKVMRDKLIKSLKIERLVKYDDIDKYMILGEAQATKEGKVFKNTINNYAVYALYVDYNLLKSENNGKDYIDLIFIKYRPRNYSYIFVKIKED